MVLTDLKVKRLAPRAKRYDVLSTPLLMVFRAINFRLYGLTNTSGLTPIACKNSN
jgi:hypothetical protein